MKLYFNANELSDPSNEYVAWIDVMGIKSAMESSIKISANFIYKLHIAAIEAPSDNIKIYPIMDGFYCSSPNQGDMEKFLKDIYLKLANLFNEENKNSFRFIIKGAIAKGDVYHGCNLDYKAAFTLGDNKEYRDKIMLGLPMIQAHPGEVEAPPFGLFVDESAQSLVSPDAKYPFDMWWKWFTKEDADLIANLASSLETYYAWCMGQSHEISYPRNRIRIHRGMAKLYFGSS